MKPMQYISITLAGKRDRFYVGRVSVDGKKAITCFEVTTEHDAKITAERLEFARESMGDMEGTAVTANPPAAEGHHERFKQRHGTSEK